MAIRICEYLLNLLIYCVLKFKVHWTLRLDVIRILVTGYYKTTFMLGS